MRTAVVARLLAAGLAATALLAPVITLAPASAVSASASCADVRTAAPGSPDGEYEITVFDKTVSVWCADMAGSPAEYLTLMNTGGPFNFSQDSYLGNVVTTHYTRVRLNVPGSAGAVFSLNPLDHTFQTSTGAPARDWGYTGSCGNAGVNANLDLRGTPFGMDLNDIGGNGWGSASKSSNNQVIDLYGGGDCGGIHASNPFPLSWQYTVPTATLDPTDSTVASGGDATFTAAGTGNPTPTITWQSSPDGATWTDIAGATGGTLTVANARYALNGTLFRALVTSSQGTDPTAAAELTVTPIAPGVSDPADANVTSGDDATFSVTLTGDPTPDVQWQRSTGGAWSNLTGETGTDLVLTGVTTADDGLLVRAVVTSVAGNDTSAAAALTVQPTAPTVTDPADAAVGSGDDATFTVAVTGDPAPTLRWQRSTGGAWSDLAGETGTQLVLTGVTTADDGLRVRAVVTSTIGSDTSAAASLAVAPAAPTVTDPADASVDSGDSATFSVDVTGDPAPTIRWQTSVDGGAWASVAGETGTDLVLTHLTTARDGDRFRAVVRNVAGTVRSAPATLTVAPAPPVITSVPLAQRANAGDDAEFSATVTGDPAPTCQWQTSVDNVVWTDVAGATSCAITFADVAAAQDGLWVRVYIANVAGAVASDGVQLTVITPVVVVAGLAITGSHAVGILGLAGLLVATGAGLLVVGRRRASRG